jgi:hypothetical protein
MWNPFRPKSVWVVHNPLRRATWCSKSDCPKLGRKKTYDVVLSDQETNTDGELENIILLGVTDEAEIDESKIQKKVRRVGEPTVKLHSLGAVASFTSKKKALQFMEDFFREHQGSSPDSLVLSEVEING